MLVRILGTVVTNDTKTRCTYCEVELVEREKICVLASIRKMEQPEIVGAVCQDCLRVLESK